MELAVSIRVGLSAAAVAFALVLVPRAPADDAISEAQAKLDARISELIAELGADEYAVREKAQRELESLSLDAFDALYAAQKHDDIEIAMRARYLVRTLRVNWSQDDDPAEVKVILRNYGDQTEAERKNRMERLAALDDHAGVAALCRLVRFEASKVLSKRAALLVLTAPAIDNPAQRAKLGRQIMVLTSVSKRPGAEWLRAHAQSLVDPESAVELWDRLTKTEQEAIAKNPDDIAGREIVRDLLRWQAEMLRRIERDEAALAVMRRSVELIDGSREQLLDTVDWLMQLEAWSVVDHVYEKFGDEFRRDALLLYRLAESQVRQGHTQNAEATAKLALQIQDDNPDVHIVTAFSLQERGLLEWAEREYRHVMSIPPKAALHDLRARFLLSEMLHDIGNELPAAEALQGAADAMENDPNVLELVEKRLGRPAGSIYSRMHYFYAQQFAADGNKDKVIEHLTKGIKNDPTDADVLIAMYRVPDPDEAWQKLTKEKIDTAVGHFRTQIKEFREQSNEAPSEALRAWANRQLASANNQFAWLVGNTEGDFEEAVRCSHESLELRPDTGGYYDTLGRCYYAKGDFANAVKYQRRAVKLEPFSGQIQRQLALFEKALAESQNQVNDN